MLLIKLFAPKSTSVSVFRSLAFISLLSVTSYAFVTIVYAFVKADVSPTPSMFYEAGDRCIQRRLDSARSWRDYNITDTDATLRLRTEDARRACDTPGERQPSALLFVLFLVCGGGALGTLIIGLDASERKEIIVRLGDLVWRQDATGKVHHMPAGAYRDERVGELFVLEASNEKALHLEFKDTGQRALDASLSLAFKPLPPSCGSPDCAADDQRAAVQCVSDWFAELERQPGHVQAVRYLEASKQRGDLPFTIDFVLHS